MEKRRFKPTICNILAIIMIQSPSECSDLWSAAPHADAINDQIQEQKLIKIEEQQTKKDE